MLRRGLLALAAAGTTAAVFRPFALLGVDPHHDGIMLKPALDVLAGQTLFRDTFSQYGAGTTYLQAAALAIGGPTLATLRLATVAAYAVAAGFLADAWGRLLPPALTLLAIAIWLLLPAFYYGTAAMVPWSSVWAIVFQAAALAALVRGLAGASPLAAGLGSGIACAFVFLCRQPVGIANAAAVFAGLVLAGWSDGWSQRRRTLLAGWACGLGVILGLAGTALVISGSAGDWYYQTVVWPRHWASQGHGSLVARVGGALILRPAATLPWLALAALVLVVARRGDTRATVATAGGTTLAVALGSLMIPALRTGLDAAWVTIFPATLVAFAGVLAWRIVARGGPPVDRELAAAGAVLVGLASWLQYFPVPDARHVFWAMTPAVGVVVLAAWEASGRRTVLTMGVLVALLLPTAIRRVGEAREKLSAPWAAIEGVPRLAGMRAAPKEASEWARLGGALAGQLGRRPDVPMLVDGRDALYATLVDALDNPGPFYVEWQLPGMDLLPQRSAFLDRRHPLVFLQWPPQQALARELQRRGYVPVDTGRLGVLMAPPGPSGLAPPVTP